MTPAAGGVQPLEAGDLRRRIRDYLEMRHTATVATVGPPGSPDEAQPHAATVFYALDRRLRLVFLSKGTSRHGAHIMGGSRVALTVAGEYQDWREIQGVQLWGTAARLRGAARVKALAVYVARFPFVAALLSDPEMVRRLGEIEVFRVTPERAALTDNQAGLFGRQILEIESGEVEGELRAGSRSSAATRLAVVHGVLGGRVISGKQEAAGFTEIGWVKERLTELLGAEPFPGTLNLKLGEPGALLAWAALSSSPACLGIEPGEEGFCPASYYPVTVNGEVGGGIVLPHVPGYPDDIVEVVAEENLRLRFGLEDGSEVRLTWQSSP